MEIQIHFTFWAKKTTQTSWGCRVWREGEEATEDRASGFQKDWEGGFRLEQPGIVWACPGGSAAKNLPAYAEDARCEFIPSVGRSPWRRKWQPTPGFFLGNPTDRGVWRAMYSPWGHKESDTTEQLNTDRNYLIQSFVQKPLQMSESPGLLVFPRQVGMEISPSPSKGTAGHTCLDTGTRCLHLKATGARGWGLGRMELLPQQPPHNRWYTEQTASWVSCSDAVQSEGSGKTLMIRPGVVN